MNLFFLIIAMLQVPTATGTIRGTVMTEVEQPVYAARVELNGGPQGPMVTRTDGEGRFIFAGLTRGVYRLSAKKEGFVRQEYGQRKPDGAGKVIVIEPGSDVSGITMHLPPAATIVGEVRNEEGYPIANILVQALRRTYDARGKRTVTLFSSTLTNDLGAYRLYWVDPGDYYVNASYLPQLPTPVNANEDAPRASYAATYFPGTSDPAAAQIVHLERGNGRTADFKLERSPVVMVRGTVYSVLGGGIRANVTLTAAGESGSTIRYSTQTDNRGGFQMSGVSAGAYVLSARTLTGEAQMGYSRIQVLDIDLPRADVVVGLGVSMGVRLFGETPPSVDWSSIRVSLIPLETHIPAPEPAVIRPDGSLSLANVQPGNYALDVSRLPGNAYIRAARSGPRDILEESVSVQYESQPPLDIQLGLDGGQITGATVTAAGEPAGEATVVLVPNGDYRRRTDQYRVVTSGANGQFVISGIPPGNYKLFAWDSVEANAWMNPEFMNEFEEFGAALSVSPNAKMTSQIRVITQAR